MERVQAALTQQLQRENERLALQLRDKVRSIAGDSPVTVLMHVCNVCNPVQHEELSRLKKRREETGVELYGFQQQLATHQMTLDQAAARVVEGECLSVCCCCCTTVQILSRH